MILQVPLWAARVIYIQGSALKDSDLSRCRYVMNLCEPFKTKLLQSLQHVANNQIMNSKEESVRYVLWANMCIN